MFSQIRVADLEDITNLTGCMKPCSYQMYQFVGQEKVILESEYFSFSLWAISKKTTVKTEQLVFPLASLVAEFGGTLSLFLGLSFISLWDNLSLIGRVYDVMLQKYKNLV